MLCLLIGSLSGCASWTNPVANGIPVRLLPEEALAKPKSDFERIPYGLLKRAPVETITLVPGDVLGIFIDGVFGNENQLPPVTIPQSANTPPSTGFPIPLRADGTLQLPYIEPVKLSGMTVPEAEAKIVEAYTEVKEILKAGKVRIILTLVRPKHEKILVIRQDSLGAQRRQFVQTTRGLFSNPLQNQNTSRQGAGFLIDVPHFESDVLRALAETGGLPGLDARDEILIYRNGQNTAPRGAESDPESLRLAAKPQVINLNVRKGEVPNITEESIRLFDGDIVVIETRPAQLYYTTGLMRNQEVPMPLDYDLTVVEAVARVGGPLLNGGFGGSNLQGSIVSGGLGNPSPSLLTVIRKLPNQRTIPIRVDLNEAFRDPRENILVMPGDVLVLQETTGESFARYLANVFNFNVAGNIFQRGDAGATGSLRVP